MKSFFNIFFNKKEYSSYISGIKIQRSSRRNSTVSLKIKDGKLIILCPNFLDDKHLTEIIKKKKSWIEKKLKNRKKIIEFSEKKNFPILGNNHKVRFVKSDKNEVKVIDDLIKISYTKTNTMKSIFINWLKNESTKYLKVRVSVLSKRIKINAQSVFVKTYQARWGSCSHKSEIFLNWKLFLLPKRIIDYVIIHELAHILVPNHSNKFWSTVEQIDSNYREKKDWLKVHGYAYIQFN